MITGRAHRSALVLTHVAFEDSGSLGTILEDHGFRMVQLEPALQSSLFPDPCNHDLVVVMGGPIGVYETDFYPHLSREIAFIKTRLSQKKPVIGICLGAQLIANALGARVYPGPVREIGWLPLHLTDEGRHSPLALLEDGLPMLHWHGDTFDLPFGVSSLARTESIPHQAFMVDNYALALQFHPEIQTSVFERWLVGHAVELSVQKIDIHALRLQTAENGPHLERRANAFFSHWLSEAGLI